MVQLIEEVAVASESQEPIERVVAKRRVVLVVGFCKGEMSGSQILKPDEVTVAKAEEWQESSTR